MSYLTDFFLTFMEKARNWYKSLTIWFNTSLIVAVPLFEYLNNQLPILREVLPDAFYKYVFLTTIVGNLLLRFHTSQALEDKR